MSWKEKENPRLPDGNKDDTLSSTAIMEVKVGEKESGKRGKYFTSTGKNLHGVGC